ncbi:MAG: metal-dependent hydrolase [Actinomycetota bacterium]
MATITVRRPEFEWPTDLPVLPDPNDPSRSCELVALSFTLPYLEPYLIRTMRAATKEVDDEGLRADMKAFSGQEAQHYQQHARINDVVRAQLSDEGAAAMRALEDSLEADYRRYSDQRSLAFNLAYAEGFEAMTFALARTAISVADAGRVAPAWANLLAWHLSEEIEHRTVTFDAYEAIVGRYPHRVAVGAVAQAHFLRYLLRMAAVLQRDTIDPTTPSRRVVAQAVRRNWRNGAIPGMLRAHLPSYDPRNVTLSDEVRLIAASQGVDLD